MLTRLKWLSIQSFRSFVEKTVIEFPTSGIAAIRGFNLDTGGSSGAGKSTINLAIAYALGFCPLPSTKLQSWLTDKPLLVELCLETAEGEVVVSRGEKLSLTINGEKLKGSVTLVEERLQKILGLSTPLLEALTYRQQLTRGMFLSKTDAGKKDFLTILLGLERFESAIEKTQARIRELEPLVKILTDEIERYSSELATLRASEKPISLIDERVLTEKLQVYAESLKELKTRSDKLEREYKEKTDKLAKQHDPQVATLRTKLGDIAKKALREAGHPVNPEEKRLDEMLSQANKHLQDTIREDYVAKNNKRAEARRLQGILDASRRRLQDLKRLGEIQKSKLVEMVAISNNTCPTCKQRWNESGSKGAALEEEIKQISIQMEELGPLTASILDLEKEVQQAWDYVPNPAIKQLEAIKTRLDHEISEVEQYNAYLIQVQAAKLNESISGVENEIMKLRNEALLAAGRCQSEAEESLGVNLAEIRVLDTKMQELGSDLHQIQIQNAKEIVRGATQVYLLQEAQERLGASQKRAEAQVQALAAERDFLALVGREGFLGSIFDEVLTEISQETNCILAMIPNTTRVVVNFKSETTTLKGKLNKEIIAVATIDGYEAPLKAGCSGGMFGAVELAVDLAVAAVVSRRTGAVPAWMVLDECFEGLGIVEKEGVLEILQKYASDKLLLVIDHASEMKSMLSNCIDVEYQDGISTIRSLS